MSADFLPILQSAMAQRLPVKITKCVKGRHGPVMTYYAARRISHFRAEPRHGLVVVMEDMARIPLKTITGVSIEISAGEAPIARIPPASISSGPYTIHPGGQI